MSRPLSHTLSGLLITGCVVLLWVFAPSVQAAIPQKAEVFWVHGDTLPQPLVPKQPLGYNQYDAELHRDDPEPHLSHLRSDGFHVADPQVLGDHRGEDRLEARLQFLR